MSNNKLFNKNFILLFAGQSVSIFGTFIYGTAIILLMKKMTDSATIIGLNSMLSVIPVAILGLFGGAITDSFNRKYLIALTDLFRGLAMLFLALVGFLEHIQASQIELLGLNISLPAVKLHIWMVLGVTLFIGLNDVIFLPTMNSLLPDLVPKDKIMRGNSLMQSATQLAQVIGQPLGGILFALFGSTFVFFLNGITFVLSSISEFFIKVPHKKNNTPKSVDFFIKKTVEGLRYTRSVKGLLSLLFLLVCTNCLFPPVLLSLPYYVEDVLQLPGIYYGYFLGSMGGGAVIGSLIFSFFTLKGKLRYSIFLICFICTALLVLILPLKPDKIIVFMVFILVGFSNMIINVILHSSFQEKIPSEFRGRFFGLLNTVVVLAAPLSYFLSGLAIDLLNKKVTMVFAFIGICVIGAACYIFLKNDIKLFFAENETSDSEPVEREALESE